MSVADTTISEFSAARERPTARLAGPDPEVVDRMVSRKRRDSRPDALTGREPQVLARLRAG